MQVHYSVDNLPSFTNSVITIGTFDGVHEGHKKIISALIKEAKKNKGESIIITFHPHPRKVVYPEEPLQLINTLNEKIELLSKTGIDHVVIVPFTKKFAESTAEHYIREFLVNNFHPGSIIIGFDHHFGKDRKGNYRLLEEYSDKCHFSLIEIPKHILDEIGVSSTKIRQALLNSKIETANKLLGYEFFFEGKVVLGDQIGRTLGYPTANLEYTDIDKIHLGHGVYAAYVQLDNILKKGMLSIGKRPTLPGMQDEKVEINIFDWEGSLYGETIRVIVKKFLRQQEKYTSLEELARQLAKDKQDSLTVL
ncbi:MAG TPA: bifunctional riboflavin kinase/FAD synthetase [Flavisolibacter sp.]|nr:bifunctional riboflavin kinase/FAD synthetase [Flavisolibacter sp.]